MGQVLAVVSQKGGVGKTTTAVNLAAAFARRGLKTLLVDVDPQGAVRYGVGLRRGHSLYGISDYIAGERSLREVILPTALPWLRVILAGTVSTETSHAGYQHQIENTDLLPNLLALARQRTHITVVDTPPGLGPVVHRVLEASQHVVVPLQCEPLALQTTPQILRGIQEIVAVNEELTLDGIVLTMFDAKSEACCRVSEYVRQHLPRNMVFDVVVPRTSAASEAFAAGQPVVLRSPADPAAQAYVNLATILAERFE
ncbi:MAG TPA: ParA family protein [Gemmatimonadaceae bacterium]